MEAPISEYNKSKYKYRLKMLNSGRRKIIDMEVKAILRIKGIGTTSNNMVSYTIALDFDGDKSSKSPIFKSKRNKILQLYLNSSISLQKSEFLPKDICQKAIHSELTLEDVLSLGTKSWLTVYAFGYDGYSGSRKLFDSKEYTLNDIKYGLYMKGNNLNTVGNSRLDCKEEKNIYYDIIK